MRIHLEHIKTHIFLFLLSFPTLSLGSGTLENPLIFGREDDSNGVAELLVAILNIVQIIAVPILVFFVIYAGFIYVTARGNPETIQKANKALVYALIGAVIVLGAQAISTILQSTVTGFES